MGKFIVITKEDQEKTVSINSNKIRLIEGHLFKYKNVKNNKQSLDINENQF
jgi:hypothetical protein